MTMTQVYTAILITVFSFNSFALTPSERFEALKKVRHQELMLEYGDTMKNKIETLRREEGAEVGNQSIDVLLSKLSSLSKEERYVILNLLISENEISLKNNPATHVAAAGFTIATVASVIAAISEISGGSLADEGSRVWKSGNLGIALMVIAVPIGLLSTSADGLRGNDQTMLGLNLRSTVQKAVSAMKTESSSLLNELTREKQYQKLMQNKP